jgi:hypothetical protein
VTWQKIRQAPGEHHDADMKVAETAMATQVHTSDFTLRLAYISICVLV